eukprot:gene84-356_t
MLVALVVALATDVAVGAPELDTFRNITNWLMTLDVGSNELKHVAPQTNDSIFVNGNMARVLLASHALTGNATHLEEGIRWCDTFTGLMVPIHTAGDEPAGYWGTGYGCICLYLRASRIVRTGSPQPPRACQALQVVCYVSPMSRVGMVSMAATRAPGSCIETNTYCRYGSEPNHGEIYFGDTGTAVQTLALCHNLTHSATKKAAYLDAMTKYTRFVYHGCSKAPAGQQAPAKGWVTASGPDAGQLQLPLPSSGASISLHRSYTCTHSGQYLTSGAYALHQFALYHVSLSTEPYIIATGTTGTAFLAALHSLSPNATYHATAKAALEWTLSKRLPDGHWQYILDGESVDQ